MYSDKVDAIQETLGCDCDDGQRRVLPHIFKLAATKRQSSCWPYLDVER
jgi:hypothetical protein